VFLAYAGGLALASRVPRLTRVRVAYDTPAGTLETGGTTRRPRIGAPMDVRYHPALSAESATLQTISDVRARAIAATVPTLIFLLLAVIALASI
jgi:hypothetical protein